MCKFAVFLAAASASSFPDIKMCTSTHIKSIFIPLAVTNFVEPISTYGYLIDLFLKLYMLDYCCQFCFVYGIAVMKFNFFEEFRTIWDVGILRM